MPEPADPYAGIATPEASDPYSGIAMPEKTADPYAGIATPEARPTVTEEFPTHDYIDKAAAAMAPLAPSTEWLGTTLDTLRRPIASMIAGKGNVLDRAGLAWDSRPELFGGHPELAPTPEQTKHALGIPEIEDKPGFASGGEPGMLWGKKESGDINWLNVLSSKVPNEAANLGTAIVTDPATYITPGLGRAAKAGVAAKETAMAARLIGDEAGAVAAMAKVGEHMPAPFLDKAAENAWLHKPFSEQVAAGQGGVTFHPPHIPLLPKIPGEAFVALPKWMAPAMEKLDFLTKHRELGLLKNPDAAEPLTMGDRLSTAKAEMMTSEMIKEVVKPTAELTKLFENKDPAWQDATLKHLTNLHEQQGRAGELGLGVETAPPRPGTFDPFEPPPVSKIPVRGLRPSSEAQGASMRSLGLQVESGNPFHASTDLFANNKYAAEFPDFAKRMDVELNPDTGGASAQWKPQDNPAGQNQAALEHLSTLSPHDLAVSKKILDLWKDKPAVLLEKQRALGIPTPELNYQKIVRPSEIRQTMDQVNAFGDPTGPATGDVTVLKPEAVKALEAKVRKATAMGNAATMSDIPTTNELRDLTVALANEFPQAVREYQAVPAYTPGGLSKAAKNTKGAQNPNLKKSGVDSDVAAQRASLHGPESGDRSIPGVSKNVALSNVDRARGSFATEGVAPGQAKTPGWAAAALSFITPEGLKKVAREMDAAAGSKMHQTRFDLAMAEEIAGPIYQAIRLQGTDGLEAMLRRGWKSEPLEAIQAVKDQARDGIAMQGGQPGKRPATLADLQQTFKANGGVVDHVTELLAPKVAEAVQSGKLPLSDAFNHEFSPHQRAMLELEGKNYFVHSGIAKQFEQIKTLGTDPYHFARQLSFAAPAVVWLNNMWKQNATFRGPQFFSYQARNQIGDMSRMGMIQALDAKTPAGMARVFGTDSRGNVSFTGGRLAEYYKTGDTSAFKGLKVDAGRMGMIDGQVFANELRAQGLLDSGELQADVLGKTLPKDVVGDVDNSWAGMASRKSKIAATAADAAEAVADKAKAWGAARENMNRWEATAARLRAGDSMAVAASTVLNGLFDFKRLSPAAHFLKDTGLVPFASWHSKVYPMVLKWAMENPGEFTASLRALDAVNQHEIDESQLPEWMRGKHNYITRKFRNAKGEMELGVVTNTGLMPLQDLREMAAHPFDETMSKVGPLLKLAFDMQQLTVAKDENKKSTGEKISTLAKDAFGRPAQTFDALSKIGSEDPRTGEVNTLGGFVANQIMPAKETRVNLSTMGAISVGSAKKDLNGALYSLGHAKNDLKLAQDEYAQANGMANTAALMTQNPVQLREYQARVQTAETKLQRMQQAFIKIREAWKTSNDAFKTVNKTP